MLDDQPDEIVVQWQLSGQCEVNNTKQDCTMIGSTEEFSSIHESFINFGLRQSNFSTLNNITTGKNISTSPADNASFLDITVDDFPPFLSALEKPVLTLFLSNALIDVDDKRVPYLEYQFLTDHPVSNSSTLMTAEVIVNNNAYRRTLEKRVQTPLIDFALQN